MRTIAQVIAATLTTTLTNTLTTTLTTDGIQVWQGLPEGSGPTGMFVWNG